MASIYHSLTQDPDAAAESLGIMMQKEQKMFQRRGYLNHSSSVHTVVVTDSDRKEIVDWCYNIIDGCEFNRETVDIAMQMVDRFLSKSNSATRAVLNDRMQFQLLALSALYISIKINEHAVFCSDSCSGLSGGLYSRNEIEAMELNILHGLSWRLYAPSSIQIAHTILSLFFQCVDVDESVWSFVLDEVHFQTQQAVRDYYFVTQLPSTVAMAAIGNAFDQVHGRDHKILIHALSLVMVEKYDSLELFNLQDAKDRLQCLVGEGVFYDKFAPSSETSQKSEAISLERGVEGGQQLTSKKRTMTTPSITP